MAAPIDDAKNTAPLPSPVADSDPISFAKWAKSPEPVPLEKITNARFGMAQAYPTDDPDKESDRKLREKVAGYLLWLFICTNSAVLLVIVCLSVVDYQITKQLVQHATTQPAAFEKLIMSGDVIEKTRSVNSTVLATLIGATAVQVGVGVLTITQYLFPNKKPQSNHKTKRT